MNSDECTAEFVDGNVLRFQPQRSNSHDEATGFALAAQYREATNDYEGDDTVHNAKQKAISTAGLRLPH